MPTYDYCCDANNTVIEIKHRMSEQIKTWGDLCERSDMDKGDTPADTPVRRLITGGQIISSRGDTACEAPSCGPGACCPSARGCGYPG